MAELSCPTLQISNSDISKKVCESYTLLCQCFNIQYHSFRKALIYGSATKHPFGGKNRLATANVDPINVIQTILTAAGTRTAKSLK